MCKIFVLFSGEDDYVIVVCVRLMLCRLRTNMLFLFCQSSIFLPLLSPSFWKTRRKVTRRELRTEKGSEKIKWLFSRYLLPLQALHSLFSLLPTGLFLSLYRSLGHLERHSCDYNSTSSPTFSLFVQDHFQYHKNSNYLGAFKSEISSSRLVTKHSILYIDTKKKIHPIQSRVLRLNQDIYPSLPIPLLNKRLLKPRPLPRPLPQPLPLPRHLPHPPTQRNAPPLEHV